MRRRIFHVPKGVMYHVGNSLRGIRKAIRGRFWAIDLDMQITKPDPHCRWHAAPHEICRGHIVGTHWGRLMKRDGFYDRLGIIDPSTPVNQMTLDEVLRLETKDGYKVARIERLLKECGSRIVAYLEPKGDKRFEEDWPWRQIKTAAAVHKTRVRVRSIRNLGGKGAGTRRIEAAKRNGFKAKTIYRGADVAKTPDQAIAAAEKQSKSGPKFQAGTCLKQCRTLYGISVKYASAAKAWKAAKYKHPGASTGPKGALEFWTGGSQGYGHVAISAGGGYCWSTDIKRSGYFDLVPTTLIEQRWGMKYVGWSEDVNDVRVIKHVGPTRWTPIRAKLLEILTSADLDVVAKARPGVKAFRAVALAALNKTNVN